MTHVLEEEAIALSWEEQIHPVPFRPNGYNTDNNLSPVRGGFAPPPRVVATLFAEPDSTQPESTQLAPLIKVENICVTHHEHAVPPRAPAVFVPPPPASRSPRSPRALAAPLSRAPPASNPACVAHAVSRPARRATIKVVRAALGVKATPTKKSTTVPTGAKKSRSGTRAPTGKRGGRPPGGSQDIKVDDIFQYAIFKNKPRLGQEKLTTIYQTNTITLWRRVQKLLAVIKKNKGGASFVVQNEKGKLCLDVERLPSGTDVWAAFRKEILQ